MNIEIITIGEIAAGIAIIVGIIKGIIELKKISGGSLNAWLQRNLCVALEPVYKEFEKTNKRLDGAKQELNSLKKELNDEKQVVRKNELMRMFALLRNGVKIDESEIKHLKSTYDEYIENHGNSYIKDEYEKFKKAGKI